MIYLITSNGMLLCSVKRFKTIGLVWFSLVVFYDISTSLRLSNAKSCSHTHTHTHTHTRTRAHTHTHTELDDFKYCYLTIRWCNGYRRRIWTRRHEFKSWTWLIAFHIALIPLGKVWIQIFSLQQWVNSRAD